MTIPARNLQTTALGTAIMATARIAFLLVGIASTAVILTSIALPYSTDLLHSSLPRIRTLFSWLSPPYLFIAVHFIIIVIWKLHGPNHHPPEQIEEEIHYPSKPSEIPCAIPPATATSVSYPPESVLDRPDSIPNPPDSVLDPPDSIPDPPDSIPDPPDSGGMDPDEAHDTMDATWKAILERGATAAAARPRMRKSDTWERYGGDREGSPAAGPERRFRKSETFRRVSVGREELFGRSEAFIRTHYEQRRIQRQESEQRRIQRQESEQRYIEMVNAAC